MRKCNKCGEDKTPDEMVPPVQKRGRPYHQPWCKECKKTANRRWRRRNLKQDRHNARLWRKRRRQDPDQLPKVICRDAKRSDRRHGRTFGLSPETVSALIARGCVYCGEAEVRMTLDRIDNDKGHTEDNVVPACIRCNYTRRSMPYEAWLVVAKGMREARERGLFGEWTGRAR